MGTRKCVYDTLGWVATQGLEGLKLLREGAGISIEIGPMELERIFLGVYENGGRHKIEVRDDRTGEIERIDIGPGMLKRIYCEVE